MQRPESEGVKSIKTGRRHKCINPKCDNPLKTPPHLFQNLPVCPVCNRLLERHMHNAKRDLKNILVTYINMLREGVLQGTIDFPELPKERTMPASELGRAMQNVRRQHGTSNQRTDSSSRVSVEDMHSKTDHKDG